MTYIFAALPSRFAKVFFFTLIGCALVACSPSTNSVAQEVKTIFQRRLDSQPELKVLGLVVERVDVIHESGNKFKGMAIVGMNGAVHQVPMSVMADGDKVMYEVSGGGLDFIAQEVMKRAFSPSPTEPEPAIPSDVKTLTDQADQLNDLCRGKPGDDPAGMKACVERDEVGKLITAKGWCWGHSDDAGYQRRWVKCAKGDS